MTPASKTPERIDYLDSLRGLAAMSVVCSHFVLGYTDWQHWPGLLVDSPLHVWWDGFAAVSLFFVLSGFVLSLKYFERDGQPAASLRLPEFVVGRLARISVPFVGVLALSFVVQRLWMDRAVLEGAGATSWMLSFWNGPVSVRDFLRQAVLIRPGGIIKLLPQDWTLTVELNVSFIVPMMVLVAARGRSWLLAFAAVATVFLKADPFVVHFAMGVVLASMLGELRSGFADSRGARLALGTVGFLLYASRYAVARWVPQVPDAILWFLTGVGAALLLVTTLVSPSVQRLLLHPVLRWMGRVSYSVYLVHFAVLLVCTPWCFRLAEASGLHGTGAAAVALAGTCAVTLGLSTACYSLLEKPSIQLGRALQRALGARRRERAVAPVPGV